MRREKGENKKKSAIIVAGVAGRQAHWQCWKLLWIGLDELAIIDKCSPLVFRCFPRGIRTMKAKGGESVGNTAYIRIHEGTYRLKRCLFFLFNVE